MEGAGTGEVGLFIDLENIRYSFLNVYQIEPNVSALIEKARKHGRVSVAMAYADFNEHPQWVRRGLDVAGIAARDIPVRRFLRDGQERLKSSADLHMLMDIMETALDRPQVSTYVIMTGDSDYIRVITWIKNRFDKRVIVSGVPGTDPDKSNAISYMLRNGLLRRYKTVTDIREVTISELDETNDAVRGYVIAAGFELDPLPVRCARCCVRNEIDVVICVGCGCAFEMAEDAAGAVEGTAEPAGT